MAEATPVKLESGESQSRTPDSALISEELETLEKECECLSTQFIALTNTLKTLETSRAYMWKSPETVVNEHIRQLKKYNETKDLALGLVSMISDQRGITAQRVFDEMKIEHP